LNYIGGSLGEVITTIYDGVYNVQKTLRYLQHLRVIFRKIFTQDTLCSSKYFSLSIIEEHGSSIKEKFENWEVVWVQDMG